MGNWVRFADTKATILTAGFGVILTMLVSNAKTVTLAISEGRVGGTIVAALAFAAGVAAVITLFWLMRAIKPRAHITYSSMNRFAWPALLNTDAATLKADIQNGDIREEAWQQVLDLAAIAEKKFRACNRAVTAFAFLVSLGVACVVTANALTA